MTFKEFQDALDKYACETVVHDDKSVVVKCQGKFVAEITLNLSYRFTFIPSDDLLKQYTNWSPVLKIISKFAATDVKERKLGLSYSDMELFFCTFQNLASLYTESDPLDPIPPNIITQIEKLADKLNKRLAS